MYKKYIKKKSGRLCGFYIYHSFRENGRILTVYLGKESDWRNKRNGTWKEAENKGKEMQRTDSHRQAQAGGLTQIKEPSNVIFKGCKPTCNCNAKFTSGIVLDPFFGAGTTGLVALKQNKKFIGIELNKEYIEIAKKRLKPYLEQRKLKCQT